MIALAVGFLVVLGYAAVLAPIAILVGYLCGVNDRLAGIDQEGRR